MAIFHSYGANLEHDNAWGRLQLIFVTGLGTRWQHDGFQRKSHKMQALEWVKFGFF